jgi:hypothetical protein
MIQPSAHDSQRQHQSNVNVLTVKLEIMCDADCDIVVSGIVGNERCNLYLAVAYISLAKPSTTSILQKKATLSTSVQSNDVTNLWNGAAVGNLSVLAPRRNHYACSQNENTKEGATQTPSYSQK